MMKLAVLASAAASAAAFAPSQQGRAVTAVADFTGEIGAQPPLGFFDPLGFLTDADQGRFDFLRECELKHGRVSMLASVGYLTTAFGYRFPNFPADVPAGFKAFPALASTQQGKEIIVQMFLFFIVAEIVNRDAEWTDFEAEFPGDYRNGVLDFGWDTFSPEEKTLMRARELNNGRAAMCGIIGLMVHEQMGVSILWENPSGL